MGGGANQKAPGQVGDTPAPRKSHLHIGKKFGEPPLSGTQGVNENSSGTPTHPPKNQIDFLNKV